jgi:outer membrane protein OmpA-like peptidoglycan-associated protein
VESPKPLVIDAFTTNTLEVQETIVTETYPLLPYVFFDSASAELRPRYSAPVNTESFREKDLEKSTMTMYYHLLDIVGSRMRANPSSIITVTGTTDGREGAQAVQRKALAEQRASIVKKFLVSRWGINDQRIRVASSDIPGIVSNDEYSEGREENRRVEISSATPALLAPVVHERFLEFVPLQQQQNFAVQVLRKERAVRWEMDVLRGDRVLATKQGMAPLPDRLPVTLDSSVMVALGREIQPNDSLDGRIRLVQDDGSVVQAACRFPIVKSQNTYELSRLSLIVFDFDRADITPVNKDMMQRFVKEAVKPESKINIVGSTDRLGEAEHNRSLSLNRAEAVRSFIMQTQPGANIESCMGVGSSRLPYDNNVPEGRYYCRTVAITVQTPRIK